MNPAVILTFFRHEDPEDVCQVSVLDKGSRSQHARVLLEGVPATGIIDSGTDITSMGEDMCGSCSETQEEDSRRPIRCQRHDVMIADLSPWMEGPWT